MTGKDAVMADESTAKRFLVLLIVWLLIAAVAAVSYKFLVKPFFDRKKGDKTSSESIYKHDINIAADSFSGYSVLRSEIFRELLKADGIRLNVIDDKADYSARVKALGNNDVQMAAFPLNTIIETSADKQDFPGTIVLLIDETKGADAIIAHKADLSSIEDLNRSDGGFVLVPASPSEFLARIVVASFNLPKLPEKWMDKADSAQEVYQKFTNAKPGDKKAFVLWEPYVSKALENPGTTVLMDSSKLRGYIIDALVVQRDFLLKNEEIVKKVAEAYLRALFAYTQSPKEMNRLLIEDARANGEAMTEKQAERIMQGIQWKNTLENYACMGISGRSTAGKGLHIEEILNNIGAVLLKTGAIREMPLGGKLNMLFYDKILASVHRDNFHPGKKINILNNAGSGTEDFESVRTDRKLLALDESQWERLVQVGTMNIKPISFARGTDRLNIQSKRDLELLARTLENFPEYYLLVSGHARTEGDSEENRLLAQKRAEAAKMHLVEQGIDADRMKAKASASGTALDSDSQTVSFVVKQMPF